MYSSVNIYEHIYVNVHGYIDTCVGICCRKLKILVVVHTLHSSTWKLMQEHFHELRPYIGFIVISRPVWATE